MSNDLITQKARMHQHKMRSSLLYKLHTYATQPLHLPRITISFSN